VRHVPDGVLRRLDDEPLAIPDRVTDHLERCARCNARRAEIALDTERAAQLFSAPQLAPDVDVAWARIRRELDRGPAHAGSSPPVVAPRPRFPRPSLRAALAVAAISIVVAGTAAAATLTTIFAPTRVTPVTVTRNELRAIAALTGLGDGHALGGFTTQSGSSTLRFGTITWASSPVQPAASLAQASAQAGFPMILPAHLPSGVGAVRQFSVQPRVTATVTFNARAAGLTGSSVTIAAGPAVVAEYSAAGGSGVPTLGVATMRRPTAQTTGASMSQIEAFLLGQPGIPPELAEEVRLLGDLRTTLPVPVPPGAKVHSVRINGWSGVLLTDASNTVAAVIWEDGRGFVHGVAGIINSQDLLNVARQLS
jgi:hypothetical protein